MGDKFGNATIKFKLKPGVDKKMKNLFLAGLIRGAQEVVATAVKNHPYEDQTGNNTRSIGWAASGDGKTGFGPIQIEGTRPKGSKSEGSKAPSTGSGGIKDKAQNLTVAVVTASGYGGFLEVGTSNARAFPYLLPAFEQNKQFIKDQLTGIY